jgi:hypothetical protein
MEVKVMAGARKRYAAARPRDASLDERLGMTRGKQSTKKMSALGRRKVSRATKKK